MLKCIYSYTPPGDHTGHRLQNPGLVDPVVSGHHDQLREIFFVMDVQPDRRLCGGLAAWSLINSRIKTLCEL